MSLLIAKITFLIGILGMLFIVFEKIPELNKIEIEITVSKKKRTGRKKLLPAGKKLVKLPAQKSFKAIKKTGKLFKGKFLLKKGKKKEKEDVDFSDDYWKKVRE